MLSSSILPQCQHQTLSSGRCKGSRPLAAVVLHQAVRHRTRCSPYNDFGPSESSVDEISSSSSSSSNSLSGSSSAADASSPDVPSSNSAAAQSSQASVPRPLSPAAAQQLEQLLQELLPKPPVSTPLTPALSMMLPVVQPHLSALPLLGLLGVLRLCNAAGAGQTPSTAWLQDWAAALHKQLPRMTPDTACWVLAEVLRLRLTQLPSGVLDDLFVGVLKEPSSCSSSSMAAALVAVAAAELAHINASSTTGSSKHDNAHAGSDFAGAGNIMIASWRSGFYRDRGGSSARSSPDITGGSQLSPLALHCCLEELGKDGRLAQLQPQELAGVAAAAAALQLKLPAGWLDR